MTRPLTPDPLEPAPRDRRLGGWRRLGEIVRPAVKARIVELEAGSKESN